MTHDRDVHLRIAEMVREVNSDVIPDIDTALSRLTHTAVECVPGVSAAGITVTERGRHIHTRAATDEYAVTLDDIQQRHGEGPCLSAARHHHTIRIEDLARDERWPRYRRDALTQTPVRALLSFEVFTSRQTMGALNLYAETPHAFPEEAEEVGLIFATHTAMAWSALLRDTQLRCALASRDIIGQAKGMLMERFGIDAVRAFELLTRLSQESNTKVIDIARKIIAAENPRDAAPRGGK